MPHPVRTVRSQPCPLRVPRWARALSMGFVLLAVLPQAGCKLIDQRTFDRRADRKPLPVYPKAVAVKAIPPLATVRFGASPESWQPDLSAIVRQALARKPGALFTVQTVIPATGSPQDQAASIVSAVKAGGQPVAQTIIDAGATSAQIDMTATTDSISIPEVRVTVR